MLKTLNFDKVLGMGDFIGYQRDRMTDKQTFNALQYFLRSQENKNERFFIGVYPSGTHHGQDSPNEKYFDGSNPLYNKFYNYDFQLGKFVDFFSAQFILWQYVVDNYIGSFYISFDRI